MQQNIEFEDDNGPPVPDDLAPADRIPPVLENEQADVQLQQQVKRKTGELTDSGEVVGQKKRKGKKGREQQQLPKKQSDTIDLSIRFASFILGAV